MHTYLRYFRLSLSHPRPLWPPQSLPRAAHTVLAWRQRGWVVSTCGWSPATTCVVRPSVRPSVVKPWKHCRRRARRAAAATPGRRWLVSARRRRRRPERRRYEARTATGDCGPKTDFAFRNCRRRPDPCGTRSPHESAATSNRNNTHTQKHTRAHDTTNIKRKL